VKAGDLLRDFRRPTRSDDKAIPPLVSNEEVYEWMTEAQKRACMCSRLLYDETTREVCRIPVVEGRVRYNLDHRIREVEAVWCDRPPTGQPTSSHQLRIVDQSNAMRRPFGFNRYGFDDVRAAPGSDYGNLASGCNEALQQGNHLHEVSIDGNTLSLYTIPDSSFATGQAPAVLRLCVYRLPLCDIKGPEDCFEIPELDQDGLIYWLLYRFNDGADEEIRNQQKADRALAQFTARYGELPSADVMRQQQEGNSSRMVYAGY